MAEQPKFDKQATDQPCSEAETDAKIDKLRLETKLMNAETAKELIASAKADQQVMYDKFDRQTESIRNEIESIYSRLRNFIVTGVVVLGAAIPTIEFFIHH